MSDRFDFMNRAALEECARKRNITITAEDTNDSIRAKIRYSIDREIRPVRLTEHELLNLKGWR